MSENINSYRANCVLVAIKEVTGLPDDRIMEAVRKFGYKDHHGMFQHQYHRALDHLGFKLEAVPFLRDAGTRTQRLTVNGTLKQLKRGTHLVQTHGHVFVVRDGRLIDHNYSRSRLGRGVVSIMRVVNATTKPLTGKLRVARHCTRKPGTRTWHAYEEARRVIANLGGPTRKQLLTACKIYNAIDLAWDIRRGNILEE